MRTDRRANANAVIASMLATLSLTMLPTGAGAQQYGAPAYGTQPPALPYPPGTSAPPQSMYMSQPVAQPGQMPYAQQPPQGMAPWQQRPAYPPAGGAPSAYGAPPYAGQAYGAPNFGASPYAQQGGGPPGALDKMIPEFGKPLPQVPPSMTSPLPPGPGWGSGYGPAAAAAQADSLEGRVLRLEQTAFGSSYPEHEVPDRLEHLEREVFGKVSDGGDSESRVQRLEAKLGGGSGAFGRSSPPAQSAPPAYRPPMQTAYQPPPPMMQSQPPPGSGYMPTGQVPTGTGYMPSGQPPAGTGYMTQGQQPMMQRPMQPPMGQYMPPAQQPMQQAMGGFSPTYPPRQPMPTSAPPVSPPPEEKPLTATAQRYLPPGYTSQAVPPYAKPAEAAASAHTPAAAKDQQSSEFQTAVQSIHSDGKSGDYFSNIQRYAGTCYARWTNFPVRVHIPMNTPESWKSSLETGIRKWSQCVPVMIANPQEPADIEVAWINHLQPRQLGITNLEIFNGRMRVTVYLLRPTYYPPDVTEKVLPIVITHEMGHALGLWGHSAISGDIMQTLEIAKGRQATVSQRDMNTLRRVYESPGLPEGFQSPQPIGWAFTHYVPLRK